MHPSRQAYVEEIEPEVSFSFSLKPIQALNQYSYHLRAPSAFAKMEQTADGYGETLRTLVLIWQMFVSEVQLPHHQCH